MGMLEGKTVNNVMVVVLWILFFALPAFAQEKVGQEMGECILVDNFVQHDVVQFIFNIEERLSRAGVDIGQCGSEYASTVKGCEYRGVMIFIVKNPAIGWGIEVTGKNERHGILVSYQLIIEAVVDGGPKTVIDNPQPVFQRINDLLMVQDAPNQAERTPMVSYEVND